MSLDATIRAAVAQAKVVFADFLVPVTLEVRTGQDGDGKPSYAAAVSYDVISYRQSDNGQLKLTRLMGGETVEGACLLFIENVTLNVQDRITLRDGTVTPIASIEDFDDPAGGKFYGVAKCGRPERGTLQS